MCEDYQRAKYDDCPVQSQTAVTAHLKSKHCSLSSHRCLTNGGITTMAYICSIAEHVSVSNCYHDGAG